jgi:hypothetical protein
MPTPGLTNTGKEKASSVSTAHSEHVIRYPRIEREIHFADIMRDRRAYPESYHCVIQREGLTEILSWTQHPSLEEVMNHAEVALTLIVV